METIDSQSTQKERGQLRCPNCKLDTMAVFHRQSHVPVNSVLNIKSREEAIAFPRGNIALGFCKTCGFISNTAFEPDLLEYSSDCEESQGYSPTFSSFARRVASDLIDKYDLHSKDIIEIGCGKGEFLSLLCELGGNRGIGFDPAYVDRHEQVQHENVTFIADYYSEKYSDYHGDFLCCRMTLEHIHPTSDFINIVRRAIGERYNTIVFFQVPDVTRILRDCSFEDIYYEHCSYFSPGSLSFLFRNSGFEVLDLNTVYDGQYIMIEAKPIQGDTPQDIRKIRDDHDFALICAYVEKFPSLYHEILEKWNMTLAELRDDGKRVVVWGSGSKGVAFLTTLSTGDLIEYVVDINPYRQGNYMAGTGQLIVSPEYLKEYQPDVVVIMNAVYRKEIQRNLGELGLKPRIMTF